MAPKKLTGVRNDSATNRALAFNCEELVLITVTACFETVGLAMAYKELHFRYLLIHLLHELDDEINKLVLQHLLRMEVCDQERNVVSLRLVRPCMQLTEFRRVYLHWLPP